MTGFALVGSSGKAFNTGVATYGAVAAWSGIIHSAIFFIIGLRLWAIGKRHGYVTQVQFFRDRFNSQNPRHGALCFCSCCSLSRIF